MIAPASPAPSLDTLGADLLAANAAIAPLEKAIASKIDAFRKSLPETAQLEAARAAQGAANLAWIAEQRRRGILRDPRPQRAAVAAPLTAPDHPGPAQPAKT